MFYGIYTLIAMLLSSFAIINSNVIDSKAQGNTDEEYAVFVDDQPNNFEETTNNNEARVLEIGFDNGAEQIEIAGTQIAAIDTTDATATEADNATTITTEGDTTTITTEGDTTTITTGGPTVITEDNATNATATGGDTPNATRPTTVTASNTFDLTIDDQPNDFEETTNNNEARVLEIGFDNGAEQIEIAGTQIIPEFGPISAIILAISIIGFILAATKYNKLSFIPKH